MHVIIDEVCMFTKAYVAGRDNLEIQISMKMVATLQQ